MKKLFVIFLLFISPMFSFSQIAGKKSKASITLNDGTQVNSGDTLYLGKGTDRRGDFVYIFQPPNVLIGVAETSLPRNYANKYFIVRHFKVQKDKRTGEKTVAVVSMGGLNYVADIDPAIDAGEIVAINSKAVGKEALPVIVQNAPVKPSLADELKKLKDLFDSGALTKDEYDTAKKKLLERED